MTAPTTPRVSVPVEPTEEMIAAYCEKIESLGFSQWVNLSTLWPVVLAAAPAQPVAGEDVEDAVAWLEIAFPATAVGFSTSYRPTMTAVHTIIQALRSIPAPVREEGGAVWNPHQITPNDIAAILDENAETDNEDGLLNASQLAGKIWRAGLSVLATREEAPASSPVVGEDVRLALEEADHLDRAAEAADDNNWQDWSATMRSAAIRLRALAALQPSPAKVSEPELFGVTGAADETEALAVALFDVRCPGIRMTDEDLHYYRAAAERALKAVSDELDHPAPDAGSEKPQAPVEVVDPLTAMMTRAMVNGAREEAALDELIRAQPQAREPDQ